MEQTSIFPNLSFPVTSINMKEPGRAACASTDECGGYLNHIIRYYDNLTDGVLFFHAEPLAHISFNIVDRLLSSTKGLSVAPMAAIELGRNHVGFDKNNTCLGSWSHQLFNSTKSLATIKRAGHYRNNMNYASRYVIRQRPLHFWVTLLRFVNNSAYCKHDLPNESYRVHELVPFRRNPHKRIGVTKSRKCPKSYLDQDFCKLGQDGICHNACSVLEQVMIQMLCAPCQPPRRNLDPRLPWTNMTIQMNTDLQN